MDVAVVPETYIVAPTRTPRDFDPNGAPEVDPATPILQRRAGGHGIHLVRRIADRIDYRRDARTNTITVTKRLPS